MLPGRQHRLWTPRDSGLSSSLCLWLDAFDKNTIILNGTTVSQWRDKSGAGNTVSQGTSTSQPGYVALTGSTSATQPFIDFTVNQPSTLSTGANPNLPVGNTPRTIFSVYTPQGSATNAAYFSWGFSANGQLCQVQNFGGHDPYLGTDNLDTDSGNAYSSGNRMMMDFAHAPGAQRISKNGGTPILTSNNLNTSASQAFEICAGNQGFGQPCSMREIIIYSIRIPDNAIAIVQGYLAWKWAMANALPTNHPYFHAPPRATF